MISYGSLLRLHFLFPFEKIQLKGAPSKNIQNNGHNLITSTHPTAKSDLNSQIPIFEIPTISYKL